MVCKYAKDLCVYDLMYYCVVDLGMAGTTVAVSLQMGSALQMRRYRRVCAWLRMNGLAPVLLDNP